LESIRVPSLIVNAKDDPFLGPACYLIHQTTNSDIHWEVPKYGGHVGFIENGINGKYWSESRGLSFIREHIKDLS
jgi:hypothetical protein